MIEKEDGRKEFSYFSLSLSLHTHPYTVVNMRSHFESRCIFYLLRLSKINTRAEESFRPSPSLHFIDELLYKTNEKKREKGWKEIHSKSTWRITIPVDGGAPVRFEGADKR